MNGQKTSSKLEKKALLSFLYLENQRDLYNDNTQIGNISGFQGFKRFIATVQLNLRIRSINAGFLHVISDEQIVTVSCCKLLMKSTLQEKIPDSLET